MTIDLTGALRRGVVAAVVAVSISLGVAACNDTTSTANSDRTPPVLDLASAGTTDTVIRFSVSVKDNLGIKNIHVQATGGAVLGFDTTFTSAVTSISFPFSAFSSRAVAPGTPVIVTASATDGAGNSSGIDTLRLSVGNMPPPSVRVVSPGSGASAVIGKSVVITISGQSQLKVRSLGFNTTGPLTLADSSIYTSPLRDSIALQDTIVIVATTQPGTLIITPFMRDSLGQRTEGTAISLTIQTLAASNTVPVVNQYCLSGTSFDNACGHTLRVEVTDSVHVEADDPSGISALGYEVRRTVGGAIDDTKEFASSGQLTFQPTTFAMSLPYSNFPTTAYIQVYARNSNGVKAYAKLASGSTRIDTVTVVAGVSRGLPFGGEIADALYHPGKDRLYLTNIALNRVEVFNLADSSFMTPVFVGSRPWGLAGWPLNRAGDMGDTLLVANSGGTNISYVDLSGGGSGTEVFRYDLPNIIAYTVTTVTSSTSGQNIQQRTKYDFSDRPQYLAATCTAPASNCGRPGGGDVILAYSTTPTAGQSVPFANRNGTLRWENLTRGTSHFFFEQAIGQAAGRGDTLEVVRYDANNFTADTLVPYRQKIGTDPDTGFYSVVVTIEDLAFRDTTFVRNSANFQRAVFGEGGAVLGSRVMSYDASRGFETLAVTPGGAVVALPTPVTDLGISPSADVSDWTANSFAQVKGVAINFDGSLAAVRGDSTYILNQSLRLQGVLGTTSSNVGLDFHPLNTGANSFPTKTRLAFAASSEPLIEVYDTRCYQRVAEIPIRDPIIGPLKAAYRNATGQLVIVGATARGVVIATLPNTFTTTCPYP